jgi:hypothetical protein
VFLRNSISVPLHLPPSLLLCFSSTRSRRSGRPCAPPPPSQHRSAPVHVPSSASLPPSPTPRWPLPAVPRCLSSARAALHRRSPSRQPDQRHLLLPTDPTCRSPAGRRRSFAPAAILRTRHANPAATRASPCRHARRWRASSCSRAIPSSSGLRAHPGAPNMPALAFAHTHFARSFLLRPPPPLDLRRASWPPL